MKGTSYSELLVQILNHLRHYVVIIESHSNSEILQTAPLMQSIRVFDACFPIKCTC